MRYRALRSRGAAKASALFAGMVAAVSLGTVGSVRATTIDLDLGTPPHVTSKVTNSFDAMSGAALQGQTLSLDFRFSHGEFVRLFTVTSNPFVALLKLQTNSGGMVDFLAGQGFWSTSRVTRSSSLSSWAAPLGIMAYLLLVSSLFCLGICNVLWISLEFISI